MRALHEQKREMALPDVTHWVNAEGPGIGLATPARLRGTVNLHFVSPHTATHVEELRNPRRTVVEVAGLLPVPPTAERQTHDQQACHGLTQLLPNEIPDCDPAKRARWLRRRSGVVCAPSPNNRSSLPSLRQGGSVVRSEGPNFPMTTANWQCPTRSMANRCPTMKTGIGAMNRHVGSRAPA